MRRYQFIILFITAGLLTLAFPGFSQETAKVKWYDPAVMVGPVIQGQGWFGELKAPYDRLAAKAAQQVRTAVWNGSRNAAGLNIRFMSNAAEIVVRYVVNGAHAMPHMPATGASGLDLYAFDKDGTAGWARGTYKFGDTIEYRFSNLNPSGRYRQHGRLYQLYLPLYNQVKWMQIGIADSDFVNFLPVRLEKPIVVYGTSIVQGACASRPGMAWTTILERKLDQPLINLGFSGNGRLEKEVLGLVTEIDARLIILDCLPNLDRKNDFSPAEVRKRILAAVKQIRLRYPVVPIALTEHCSATIPQLDTSVLNNVKDVNRILQEAFRELQSAGEKNIYLLSAEEITFNNECTVDGIHPNDLGMQRYADAYEKIIRKILSEPAGSISTTKACIQYRDVGVYNWQERHQKALSYNKLHQPKTVFLGNSITHYWGGAPEAAIQRGRESWDKYFKLRNAVNLGFGWDRIENVLWRVYHGELDGYQASDIVLLIGTNNLSVNTDEEIITGLDLLLDAIKLRQPKTKILLMGLLPRRDLESRIEKLNRAIAKLGESKRTGYLDTGKSLLNANLKINEALFSDGTHPNAEGYNLLARLIVSRLSGQ